MAPVNLLRFSSAQLLDLAASASVDIMMTHLKEDGRLPVTCGDLGTSPEVLAARRAEMTGVAYRAYGL